MTRRALRFPLRLPLKYRIYGDATWRTGEVVNISATGVLFQASAEARKGVRIDVSIDLPGRPHSMKGTRIVARGTIVRCFADEKSSPRLMISVGFTGTRHIRE